jgi:hypothetical protein
VALESNSGVISRLVSDSVEGLEESEDEEVMAGEGYAGWCSCYRLEEGDGYMVRRRRIK